MASWLDNPVKNFTHQSTHHQDIHIHHDKNKLGYTTHSDNQAVSCKMARKIVFVKAFKANQSMELYCETRVAKRKLQNYCLMKNTCKVVKDMFIRLTFSYELSINYFGIYTRCIDILLVTKNLVEFIFYFGHETITTYMTPEWNVWTFGWELIHAKQNITSLHSQVSNYFVLYRNPC